jgi:hypothetical protein
MFPTAAAAWAARGEGGSPWGVTLVHLPGRTSKMWTSEVAPARRMPEEGEGRSQRVRLEREGKGGRGRSLGAA